MKGIILLNGEPPASPVNVAPEDFVICCDGAYRWALSKVSKVDCVTGDFDSLGYVPAGADQFPREKNSTDGEIALEKLLSMGIRKIEIYGGGGGREDHLFGNLQLLYAAHSQGARATMFTSQSEITCAAGRIRIDAGVGQTFSLAPVCGSAHIMSSSGVKYPLQNLTLQAGSCRGISNVITEDPAELLCDRGALFVFRIVRGKE